MSCTHPNTHITMPSQMAWCVSACKPMLKLKHARYRLTKRKCAEQLNMPALVRMNTDLTSPWWARWIPSAAHVLTISDTGLEISSRQRTEKVAWTAINDRPEKTALWFLNMVRITTPRGTSRFFFGKAARRDAAWKTLTRAWYTPRVIEAQTRLHAFKPTTPTPIVNHSPQIRHLPSLSATALTPCF